MFLVAFVFAYSYLGAATESLKSQELKYKSKELPTAEPIQNKNVDDSIQDDNRVTTNQIVPSGDIPLLTANDFKIASYKQNKIQKRIQEAMIHSWKAYHRYSWGQDHLKPLSKTSQNWFHIGLTILDSLDTLLMAGLDKGKMLVTFLTMRKILSN